MAAKSQSPAAGQTAALAPIARFLYLMLALGVFLADRLTKALVEGSLPLHDYRVIIPDFFHLVHVKNQGIAFGLFADSPSATKTFLLVFLSAIALGGVALLFWTASPVVPKLSAGLSLILGGALGNLVDRVQGGGVVDFLLFFVGSYHWPAFNLADSAIVTGGGLLLLHLIRDGK